MTDQGEGQEKEAYIVFDRVSKVYASGPSEVKALDELSVSIPEHSFSVFCGPSGSGKSTLLHLLGALDQCTGGSIYVNSRNINLLSETERTRYRRYEVGFVFQSLNLLPNLTALENVLVPFIPDGSSHKMRARAKRLLDDAGIGQRIHHRPGQLSGGERQRVSIARALLKDPSLILADEPTGELDRETGQVIFNMLRRIRAEERTTVVVVTHDTEYIESEDVTFELQDGQIVS